MKRFFRWFLGIFLIIAIAAGGCAAWWFDGLFEEPGAEKVPSLVGELGAQRVLAVFAHPDDEQLVAGLLLRAARDDGVFTALVTATKGEAGHQTPQVGRQSELGLIRHAEVLKNGWALGVERQAVWDYPDGGVPDADFDKLVGDIRAAMIAYQPDLVVTFWPESGASHHPDHMRMGLATQTAARNFERAGTYGGPRHIAYILMPRKIMRLMGGEGGVFIAEHQPEPDFAMPGEPSAKKRGWKIHASQRDFVQAAYGAPDWLFYAFYDKEHYAVEALR